MSPPVELSKLCVPQLPPGPDESPFQKQLRLEVQQARKKLASLCRRLKKLGVSQVRIDYDGYGDSGAVENVAAFRDGQETPLGEPLATEIGDAVETLLPLGWEIDSGAFGHFELDVASRRLLRHHHWRVETTSLEEEETRL